MGGQDETPEHIIRTVFGSIPLVLMCSVLTIVYRSIKGRERFPKETMVQSFCIIRLR